ncbi:MAG: ATPase [Actinobacteria bacterium]|nr:ATPase [Actinomycetota bacterium]
MDALKVIEEFEDLISKSKRLPLTSNIIINEGKIYEFLDRLKASFPEEFKQARWIVKERDQVLNDSRKEADRIVKEAQENANKLVSETEIIKKAHRESEVIIKQAETKARGIRLEAEDYIDSKLANLEATLQKLLLSIEKGRDKLSGKTIEEEK